MYCKYCGTELGKDGLCPKCGIVFETEPHTGYEDLQTTYTEKSKKHARQVEWQLLDSY